MRVGFVLQDRGRQASGLDTYVWNLWDALRSAEDEHELVAVTLPDRFARRAYLRLLWEQIYLPLWVRRRGLDLLHVPAGSAPLLTRVPVVLTLHDFGDDPSFRYHTPLGPRLYFRRTVPWSARFATWIITDSAAIRDEVVARLNVSRDRVRVVPLAAPPWCAQASPAAVERVRARYGLHERYFLQVGAGIPRKNLCGALQALQRLRQRRPDASVTYVATGRIDALGLDPECRRLLETGDVRLLGHVPHEDLAALYTGALAVVVPSFYEGFGLPLVEAFACGTPAIASRVSSLPEVGGDAALYVDPADPESIADAMERYATSPKLRAAMGARARARSGEFTWQRAARETLRVYSDALAAPAGGRKRAAHASAERGRHGPKVLFVRLDSLGDLVLTTPCFDVLLQKHPDAQIDVVVQPTAAPLLAGDSRVRRVLTLAAPWRGRWGARALFETMRTLRALRRERYDYVLVLRRDLDDALFARLCGGRQTLGFAAWRTRPLLSRALAFDGDQHTLENHLRLMALLGCDLSLVLPSIACAPADEREIDRLLVAAESTNGPIAVAPFGSSKAKRLSPEKGAAIVEALAQATGAPIVLVGAAADRGRAEVLLQAVTSSGVVIDLVGRTSLPELCSVLRRCRLLVSVDSGPMHLAAALGLPVVALFGAEDPRLWAPRGPAPQRLLRGYDERGRPALDALPVGRIVAAARELLAPTAQPAMAEVAA